jgi:hypothetical protein
MASRRDSASERLKKSIEAARNPLPPERSLVELGRKYGLVLQQTKVDWNDRALRALCAHEALLLNPGELDEPIRKAFAAFGYDPLNPFDWRKLIWYFAFAHFPPARKKGAPKKWNDDRWCQLLSDFDEVKTSSRPTASETEICNHIKTRFGKRYPTITATTLRKNLQYARNPSRNGILASLRDQFAMEIRNWAIAQLGGSTSSDASTFNPMAVDLAREYLESAWKRRKRGPE